LQAQKNRSKAAVYSLYRAENFRFLDGDGMQCGFLAKKYPHLAGI